MPSMGATKEPVHDPRVLSTATQLQMLTGYMWFVVESDVLAKKLFIIGAMGTSPDTAVFSTWKAQKMAGVASISVWSSFGKLM